MTTPDAFPQPKGADMALSHRQSISGIEFFEIGRGTSIGLRLSVQNGLRTVQAQVTDGQGTTSPQAFLHFELYNCGPNNPQGLSRHGVRQRERVGW